MHSTIDLELKSLHNNQAWQDTKRIYLENQTYCDKIIEHIALTYEIDSTTSRDAILYEIMSCQYGNNTYYISKNSIKWFIVYLVVFIFIISSGLLSILVTLLRKKHKVSLLYEEMWTNNSLYSRFYTYIDEQIANSNFKKSILFISPSFDFFIKPIKDYKGVIINRRYANMFFDLNTSLKVFINDILFIKNLLHYSKNANINFTYLYLRFIRKFLMYTSQCSDIRANILVSAGDYYWNPIKYFTYKKNIKNIILIQHNYINEYLHLRMFQYCDYYFSHSDQAVKKHELCGNTKFFSVGSFQLIPFLGKRELVYDIVFISQTVYGDLKSAWPNLDQHKLREMYHLVTDNFHNYLKNNRQINAAYISKIGNDLTEPALSDKEKFRDLENIQFFSVAGRNTFDIISKCRLVINVYSSVGFEAYGLNKKVLWINYNRCCDIFKYDVENEDLHVMINDTSYQAFEERINLLLSQNKDIHQHYAKLKQNYMNIQENPAKIVADKIYELLGKANV